MIKFNELGVTLDGRNLIIDVSVRDMPFYEDEESETHVTIGDIYIVNQDQYKDTGSYKLKGNHVFHVHVPEDKKHFRVSLTNREICHLDEDLFFVLVETRGEPREDTPCGMDEEVVVGATYYEGPIYHRFMHVIRDVERTCEIPKDFVDQYLRLKAVQYALESAHYAQACQYWNAFIRGHLNDSIVAPKGGCACNRR